MVIEEHARLEVTLPDGKFFKICEEDIINNSLSITSKCMDDSSFSLGGVYSTQLSVKIRLDGTNSYNVTGAKIKVYSKYDTDESEHLRGIFWATSVSRIKNVYTISASDSLIWLDSTSYEDKDKGEGKNPIYEKLLSDPFIRTLQDLLGLALEQVNGILSKRGIDNISIENYDGIINDSPTNGFHMASPEAVGKIYTTSPRDYASWISELACGFICTVPDSDISKIRIGQFEKSPSFKITENIIQHDSCEIADFTLNFIRVYAELYDGSSGSSYDTDENGEPLEDGVTIDFSDNPFLVGHWEQNSQNALDVLGTAHNGLSDISVRPFKIVCHCKEYFRLGQCVTLPNGQNSVITSIKWQFRGGYTLSCSGKDTRILCTSARRSQAAKIKDLAYTKINYNTIKLENEIREKLNGGE